MIFRRKVVHQPIFRQPFDMQMYVGADKPDVIAINIAKQNGHKLGMDKYGHVFDETTGVCIAEYRLR